MYPAVSYPTHGQATENVNVTIDLEYYSISIINDVTKVVQLDSAQYYTLLSGGED